LEILNLESGEREKMFQFHEEFNGEVEKDLTYNQKWIVIPFEHQTLILDIERSKIKYLEKAKGKFILIYLISTRLRYIRGVCYQCKKGVFSVKF
jgi:hypothetical protein